MITPEKLAQWKNRLAQEKLRSQKGPVDIQIVPETLRMFLESIEELVKENADLKSSQVEPQLDTGKSYLSKLEAVAKAAGELLPYIHCEDMDSYPQGGRELHDALKALREGKP